MGKPKRVKTRVVKDKSLAESLASSVEESLGGTSSNMNLKDHNDKGFYIDDSSSPITHKTPVANTDVQIVQIEYEKKIKTLEKKLDQKELNESFSGNQDETLTKNEQKLINAIRSEALSQKKKEPVIGRSLLMKKYKIGPNYLTKSIESLEVRGYISRKKIPYSTTQTTFSWELLI